MAIVKSLAKLGGAVGKVCLILLSLRVDIGGCFQRNKDPYQFFSPAVQGRCLRAVVAFVPSQCSLPASVLSEASCRGGFQLRKVIPISFIFSIKMSFILAEGQNPFSQSLLEQQK